MTYTSGSLRIDFNPKFHWKPWHMMSSEYYYGTMQRLRYHYAGWLWFQIKWNTWEEVNIKK